MSYISISPDIAVLRAIFLDTYNDVSPRCFPREKLCYINIFFYCCPIARCVTIGSQCMLIGSALLFITSQTDIFLFHIQVEHEGLVFKCDKCSLTFKNDTQFKRHMHMEHSNSTKYDCKFCGKRCADMKRFKAHEASHQEPQYQCSICAKTYRREDNLIAHERLHRGERPFNCTNCSASFTTKQGLRQHRRGVHKISGPQGGKTGWSRKRKRSKDESE